MAEFWEENLILRVLCGSLLLGTFLSPGFFLSLGGALASLAALRLGSLLPGKGFGPVGYSVLASLAHMSGQFTIAWLLFVPHPALWRLFPVLLTAALLFGCISGIIARAMCQQSPSCRA